MDLMEEKINPCYCYAYKWKSKSLSPKLQTCFPRVLMHEGTSPEFRSELARIAIPEHRNPIKLFKSWLEEVIEVTNKLYAHTMNLATVSETGRVSSRNVVMTVLEDDCIHFRTSKLSPKYNDIVTHPQVALTFIWFYLNKEHMNISRQVRIEGIATEMDEEYTRQAFDNSRMDHKFRTVLCRQSCEVDWYELQRRHDDLLYQVTENIVNLEMPQHIVCYKVIPQSIEFYHTLNDRITIPDRIMFIKNENKWTCGHLEA